MSNSNRERQRQFGLKLLVIAIIVTLLFTVWYLSEKRERNVDGPVSPMDTSVEINLSRENTLSLEEAYLKEVEIMMQSNYDDVQLDSDFGFHLLESGGEVIEPKDYNDFWASFSDNYGDIDVGSVRYDEKGRQVRVYFETDFVTGHKKERKAFWRLIQFSDTELGKPVVFDDALIEIPFKEKPATE